jgi:hypothetical protein
MEKVLTAAGKVRRKLKAGAPVRIINQRLSALDAMHRLVTKADKGRNLMRKEGLDPDDIKCALIYSTPEHAGAKWLPDFGKTHEYFAALEEMARTSEVWFLGILWHQEDHEAAAKGEPGRVSWVTQFMAGPEVEKILFGVRDFFVRGGHKTQDN